MVSTIFKLMVMAVNMIKKISICDTAVTRPAIKSG